MRDIELSAGTMEYEDTGGARVARAVLVSCDAFDNFPPGLTGKTLVAAWTSHGLALGAITARTGQ